MHLYAILAVVMHVAVVPIVPAGQDAPRPPRPAIDVDRSPSTTVADLARAATTPYRVTPDAQVRLSVQRVDGHRLNGELTAWSDAGIEGSFGRHAWREIRHDDVWRLHRLLMNDAEPVAWLRLGGVMLRLTADQPGAANWAERAFRIAAERSDQPVDEAVDAVRQAVNTEERERAKLRQMTAEHQLQIAMPAARQWPPTPWPVLSVAQQRDGVRASRTKAQDLLRRAGVDLPAFESVHFMFFADMTADDARRWTDALEVMYRGVGDLLGFDDRYNVFRGKCIVIAFDDQERFRLAEVAMFSQFTPVSVKSVMHAAGAMPVIVTHRDQRDEAFADELVRQIVRAVLHQYRSPHRLPMWANEGLVRYFAAQAFQDTPADLARRDRALAFIRSGGDVNAALSVTYDDAPWPGEDHLPSELGYLMIELMVRERPEGFRRWVTAVKRGKDWEGALREDYGVPRRVLTATFTQYYAVND
jgi:hypothetical protein